MPTYKDYPISGIDYEYEQFESLLVTSLLRHGMQSIDVGANSGHYTQLMALYSGFNGRVLSVEPDPAFMVRVRQSAWGNGLQNVDLLCCAVSDRDSVARLYLDNGCGGDNRLVQHKGENRRSILVPTLTLDSLSSLLPEGRVDFIKIDVQGAELAALHGGQDTFRRNPGMGMLVEYSPSDLCGNGTSGAELTGFLHRVAGFEVFMLDGLRQKLLHVPKNKSIRDEVLGENGVANLLCLKGSLEVPGWVYGAMVEINEGQVQ